MANFSSDNIAPASPEILTALVAANQGTMPAYGNDPITERVVAELEDLFETPLSAFPIATGTAANALALSCLCPSFGVIFCHKEAHIHLDECLAPEFYTQGAKLVGLPGYGGKIAPQELIEALTAFPQDSFHAPRTSVLSISQATEAGTAYSASEIQALSEVCQKHNLLLHMDGARFANAVASQGISPAELSWRSGVNCLTFGATKNGAISAEIVIFFPNLRGQLTNLNIETEFKLRQKRGGHLQSKSRFISAQWEAYLQNGLWLGNAAQANQSAKQLEAGLSQQSDIKILWPVQANEIFVSMPQNLTQSLMAQGHDFMIWGADPERADADIIRLVTSFVTTSDDIEQFLADISASL